MPEIVTVLFAASVPKVTLSPFEKVPLNPPRVPSLQVPLEPSQDTSAAWTLRVGHRRQQAAKTRVFESSLGKE